MRVDCYNCLNFIDPELKDKTKLLSGIKVNAKCKLGKRVMFRKPKNLFDDNYGYIRFCDDYTVNWGRLENCELDNKLTKWT